MPDGFVKDLVIDMVVNSISAVMDSLGQFFGINSIGAMYLMSVLLSLGFSLYAVQRTGSMKIGVPVFVLSIFGFSFLGMFPLWIIAVVLVMAVAVILKIGDSNGT